jgi:peptidoglycan hydrolase CwlO-like protein
LANGKKITETISKSKQTYYEYELELNESKREIKLLRSEFVTQSRSFYQTGLMDELIRVLNE